MRYKFILSISFSLLMLVANAQNVGIGTATPMAPFNVAANKTVLFGSDTTSAENKLMWIPSRGTFSAGNYSIRKDTALYSTSLGFGNAYSNYSTAMGRSYAHGNYSTAMGSSGVDGQYSTAMGNSQALGRLSTAMGLGYATGDVSTAMGTGSASAPYSTAIGEAKAMGGSSTAMGEGIAMGPVSTAMGLGTAKGQFSTAMGKYTIANSENETVIGTYNDPGANATNRLFEIGNGIFDGNHNALTVLNNGMVGIGITNPIALLQVDYASSLASPQLLLNDLSNSYARLTFQNQLGKSWTIASVRGPTSANDRINFYDEQSATDRFIFFGNGNATFSGTLTQNSDERLKANIHPVTNVLSVLGSINAYTYTWKDANRGSDKQIGFVAQEIEKVYPQLVRTDDKGMKSVAYQNMVPVLLQAIKEQQSELEIQQQRNTSQQKQIDQLLQNNFALQKQMQSLSNTVAILNKQVKAIASNVSKH